MLQSHVVLTNGRSGSNFLVNIINQHPQVANYGEVLGEWMMIRKLHKKGLFGRLNDPEYMDHILSSKLIHYIAQLYASGVRVIRRDPINFKSHGQLKSIGFKEFQINFTRLEIDNYLAERPHIRVINLYREDVFRRFLSAEALNQTQVVSATEGKSQTSRKVRIETSNLIQSLDVIAEENRLLKQMADQLGEQRVYTVKYEDLFSEDGSREIICDQIFEFLGLTPIKLKSRHRKILSNTLRDTIENFDEVKEIVKGTPYEVYLEESSQLESLAS
ncbi:MAG: hypothetical protein ACI93R_001534 [Flavobacteriales bacterium]|jgi:hypothetical protein